MKAARLHSYGDVDQFAIDDIPTPEPGAGEILIKIEASAVNPFDLIVRQGYMARLIPLELPAVLGGDAAGVVARVGNGVSGFSIGDWVIDELARQHEVWKTQGIEIRLGFNLSPRQLWSGHGIPGW